MAYSHIAHDVRIGNHTVISNGVTFAGHVTVDDWAVIGAFTGIHQFCRVGRHSMIGGYSVVTQDILPFATTVSEREIRVFGENRIGLERRGFPRESIEAIHKALRLLTRSKLNTSQALKRVRKDVPRLPEIEELVRFIESCERGFVK